MNNKNFHLTNEETLELNKLEVEWNHNASVCFRKKFGNDYHDFGSVIGAGVEVYRKRGNALYQVASWRGSGKTGESESFEAVALKVKTLGFVAYYSFGHLD